jgi:hypothetical protein
MARENYANLASTTLANTVASGDTSISVASSTGFPASGQTTIKVGNEIMLVTGGLGSTTWAVARAQEGTTAGSYGIGTVVQGVLTDQSLRHLVRQTQDSTNVSARRETNYKSGGGIAWSLADNPTTDACDLSATISCFQSGGAISRPNATQQGRFYFPTDGTVLWYDTGAAWNQLGPLWPQTPPPATAWTAVNPGAAVQSFLPGGPMTVSISGYSNGISGFVRALPAPPYTITVQMLPTYAPTYASECGMILRDSASGKLITYNFLTDANANGGITCEIGSFTWNSPTSFNGIYDNRRLYPYTLARFHRIRDDGTTRTVSLSGDGIFFARWLAIARSDFITPDQIGFYVYTPNQSFADCAITVMSFVQGA